MNARLLSAAVTSVAAALSAPAFAISTINLDFNGSGNTLAATGFPSVYNLDPTGFNVGGGVLTMTTLPGDDFGNYENDPDTAKNMFFSDFDPLQRTVVEAKINVQNLNVNFHGGGVWFGTDQDHRVRLGIVNNSFEGGVSLEALRENQDFWTMNVPPGPGNDIQGERVQNIQASPQTTPIDIIFRLIRDGTGAGTSGAGGSMFYSLDNGATFTRIGAPGFTFDGVVTGPGQGPNGGPSIEGGFKVGVWAHGGPDGQIPATFAFDYFKANSGDTAWANNANGNYEVWNNWTLGVPSAVEATANFGNVINANRTITITDPNGHNLGTANFNSTAGIGYTIAAGAGGTTAFNNGLRFFRFGGASAAINVTGGNHEISAPITYSTNTVWNVAGGSTLRLTGASTFDNNAALTKSGAGSVETRQVLAQGLTVNAGTVRITPNGTAAATSNVHTLSAPSGRFDITNNAVVVDYNAPDPSPLASIKAQIASAYAGGAWTGNGITTSNGDSNHFAVGYGERSALATVPAIFGTVDADAVLIRETRYGDATLDGTVNLSDFNKLAGNFGQTGKFWTDGDFNYDGTVNLGDFNLLAGNFGLSAAGSEVTPQDWSNLASAVPEPSTLLLGGVPALAGMWMRRRRAC
jgi:hypothetical protein